MRRAHEEQGALIPVSRPSVGQEEIDAVAEVLKSGWLGLGAVTFAFEEEIKRYIGCEHAVAVNTGTSALHIALTSFGVGHGDEVIVPSITFAGCVQAIISAGAHPVFCESLERDLLMDVDDVERRIGPRTRAVMPVHFGGNPCDMSRLLALAEARGLWIIEDAAHAFGSTYKGRRIGSFGHAACFSFDPIKNITCGEGGAVVLGDDQIAEEMRRRRNLGIDREGWDRHESARPWFYEITTAGYRYHMPNLCAAIGLAQFKKIEDFISRRREICLRYKAAFADLTRIRTLEMNYDGVAPHIYVIRVLDGRRDEFMRFMRPRGVDTRVHYTANHVQPFFKRYATEPLPVAAQLSDEIVTLPLYYGMTEDEVARVIESVLAFE